MKTSKKIIHFFVWVGVVILQLIMTQVVTLLFSLLIPGVEEFQYNYPVFLALVLSLSFSTGVFLAGWLALKLRWLASPPKYPERLAGSILGASLPLILALILYGSMEPGNPFFFVSMLMSILGFHIPGWIKRK